MSIEKITHCTPCIEANGCPKLPEEDSVDYRLVETHINFLNPKTFIDGMKLSDHEPDQACTPVAIRCYSDCKKLRRDFNFHENGFEFCKLEEGSSLSSAIEQCAPIFRSDPGSIWATRTIRNQVKQFLVSWGQKNGIQGVPMVRYEGIYRNSDPAVLAVRPFCFAHVDFGEKGLTDPSTIEGTGYKERAQYEFGPMSNEAYTKLTGTSSATWFNVWIPLHEEPSNSTLALMDNIDPDLQKMRPISVDGATSFGLHPDPKQKWVMLDKLTLKDRVIIVFNTTDTFHAGINRNDIPQAPRTSIEFRGVFLIPPKKNS